MKAPGSAASQYLVAFDDGSVLVVTESDLEGYDSSLDSGIWADLSVVYGVRVAGKAALARISCLWFRCRSHQRISGEKLGSERSCSIRADHLGGISVDIHIYWEMNLRSCIEDVFDKFLSFHISFLVQKKRQIMFALGRPEAMVSPTPSPLVNWVVTFVLNQIVRKMSIIPRGK